MKTILLTIALATTAAYADDDNHNLIPAGAAYLNDDVHNEAYVLMGGPSHGTILTPGKKYKIVWGSNDGNLTIGNNLLGTPGAGNQTTFTATGAEISLGPINAGQHGPTEPVTARIYRIED